MSVNAYINFQGQGQAAVTFYTEVFNLQEPQLLTYGSVEYYANRPEVKDYILHTELNISGSRVMISDILPEEEFVRGNGFALALVSSNKDELQQAFDRLQVGGKVTMPLQQTFFSEYYGMLEDQFGINWLFTLEK